MKKILLSFVLSCLVMAGYATTVTVNASASGYATAASKTSGSMIVSTSQRGYAVFDLAASGIPAAAIITSVKVTFTYSIAGTGSPTRNIYGYEGNISSLSAGALYSGAVTSNTLYTATWGTSATTKTMNTTAAADTFIKHNLGSTISLTWVESTSARVYTISGAPSMYLTIVYTCTTPSAVSISASANPICTGSSLTLTGNATGGSTYAWAGPNGFTSTARNPAAFTVNTASAGVYSFTATSTCNISTQATSTIVVKTPPAAISGASSVCIGASTLLSNAVSGGTWTSSSARATVNSTSGLVTGVSSGAATITYTTGCGSTATQAITVTTTPAAISGAAVVCIGATTTLTDATAGGTWSSSDPSIATVSTGGVVTGVSSGNVTISYGNSCGTVTKALRSTSAAAAISGTSAVCVGSSVTLTESVLGGTWIRSNTRVTFDTSVAGTNIVTGVTSGATTISYNSGCGTIATLAFTTSALPNAISGSTSVCSGSTTALTCTPSGGVWSSTNNSVGSVSATGTVRGMSQGTVTISYTRAGCASTQVETVKIPAASITGAGTICAGSSINLANTSLNGTWSSSNSGQATVSATGVVTGVAVGSPTISYTTGCGSATTASVSVIVAPAAITGTTTICTGSTSALSNATPTGSWSTSAAGTASVNASGTVTGVTQGSATITYSIASCYSTADVTIKTTPAAITGTTAVCNGGSSTLANTSNGGTWSTSNAGIASINTSTALVSSVAPGTATITYTTGCGSAATVAYNVDQLPAALSGATAMCSGTTESLTETVAGGTWSSSNNSVATVSNTGVVTGLDEGTTNISYTTVNGCGTNSVAQSMNVSLTGKWLGVNTDWNDVDNWPCGTVPDASVNAYIPSGTAFLPDFTGADFTMKDLKIAAGVTVPVSGDANLIIKGNLTVNGTVNGDGQIVMNGSGAQTIYGNGKVSNITLDNAAGATINSGDTLRVTLEVNVNAGALNANGGLTLVSDSLNSARIAPVAGGAITGNVNVQQYFQGGRRAYRFIGHPFSTSIPLSQIVRTMDVTGTGGAANGFTTTGSNSASSFWYNTTVGSSALGSDPGWKAFTNANANVDSNEFKRYQGIRLFVRGSKGEGLGYLPYTPSAATITMTGTLNTGDQSITLHKGTNSDYNQVSNPYPSATNIGNVIAAAQSAGQVTGSAFYVWNPFLGSAGAYQAKPIGVSYVIGANTSFQVRAHHDGAALSFTEADKATDGDDALLKTAAPAYIALDITDGNGHPWDAMYLSFNSNASATEDSRLDATKAINPDLNFYSLSADGAKLSIDARPYVAGTVIPMGFTTNYAQQYVIKASNVTLPAGATLYLHDKLNGSYTLLEGGAAYSFTVTSDKNTQGENRFELTTGSAATAAQTNLQVTMQPNPASSQVTVNVTNAVKATTTVNVYNVAGALVAERNLGEVTTAKISISLNELPAGAYMVEVAAAGNKTIQKLIKE